MGIVERKEREREEMRVLILDAAQKLFVANGFEKVSIRNIADAIEYSPATIYLYYKDKNELLYALHSRGFAKMADEFIALQVITEPFEKLVQMGRVYIDFAIANPELFDLMFIMRDPLDKLESGEWVEGHRAFDIVMQTVQECIDAGGFQPRDARTTAMMIWSGVHGYTALYLRKRLDIFPACDIPVIMEDAYSLFCDVLKRGLQ
ncbi:TetR/AcrR family transcriptional regulator [Spirosoma rhododendri]|uniref:TetR/AcrR family transcriptional regulator n=1 Tax=Spirosoma rhododendri TaxID=2728024 RepID=A0A7L5DMV5_9BACT|nr:TetR/AcrR family transcriptional regulator [Spirosoma rhododendri]QJD79445.1 TetR/AcrR family transcriptional regulator [Spirosoma rhododendri]